MNCHKGFQIYNRLTNGGIVVLIAAGAIGGLGLSQPLAIALLVAGVLAFAAGMAVGYRFVVCPHCEEPLYDCLRLPSRIPDSCPHCGKKIDES